MFDEYKNEIAGLEKKLPNAAPLRPVAFYGSSSFRLWEGLDCDFSDVPVLNVGFGGSTTEQCVYFFERLIPSANPRALVLYAGDNDLGQGQTPDKVVWEFQTLHNLVQTRLGPDVPFLFISIKPSLARWHLREQIKQTNARIKAEIANRPRSTYVDIWPAMLTENHTPRPELFEPDGLHVNAAGYALWREAITKQRAGNF